jgi:polysaccharide biosynthesis protein PslG
VRPKLAALAAAAALLALAQPADAWVPPSFIGISPQGDTKEPDYALMEAAGVRSVRLPLFWSQIEPVSPFLDQPQWSKFDRDVELAARHGMTVLPFVSASPGWISPEGRLEPVARAWQRRAWAAFLRRAVDRYGSNGSFWWSNPELPYLPIRRWEIWNEPNIVTFGRADPEVFASLVRLSGRVVHGADGGAELILGGLFGRPLQIPPNVGSGDFLSRLYRARRVKRYFDGVALHPYVAAAAAMRAQIRNLRRVMRVHGDAATPLYVTELGWGSDSFESRWERGPQGQARELDRALAMLTHNRGSWRIGGVWWFSLADAFGSCQFCDSAGLLTENREAKPSWYVFNAWTGGDAFGVPEASFGDPPGLVPAEVPGGNG